ncbi:cystatin-2-like [Amblyomma americanum]
MNALQRAAAMTTVRQAVLVLLFATATTALICCHNSTSVLVGGWTRQEPRSNPKYVDLAHYAISQQREGRKIYDTLVNLTEVYTQVVAGVNYRLVFTTAPSNCTIGKDTYSAQRCVPVEEVNGRCTAVVYEVPWTNTTGLTSYACSPTGQEQTS